MGVSPNKKIGIVETVIYNSQIIKVHGEKQLVITAVVLVWDGRYFRGYKGIGTEIDGVRDLTSIVSWGNQITLRSAQIIFGEIEIDGHSLSENYQSR